MASWEIKTIPQSTKPFFNPRKKAPSVILKLPRENQTFPKGESKLNITKEEITKKLGKSFTRFFLIKAIITMVINWKNTIKMLSCKTNGKISNRLKINKNISKPPLLKTKLKF